MSDPDFYELLEDYVASDISEERFQRLHTILEEDARARSLFRERMDLEAGLRTWATEGGFVPESERTEPDRTTIVWWLAATALALSLGLAIWLGLRQWRPEEHPQPIANLQPIEVFGTIYEGDDCVWGASKPDHQFGPGTLKVESGAVELRFASDTKVVLEGPCELEVVAENEARLHKGNVVVDVSELSAGFRLMTPDGVILDEGTEYAVSLDDLGTEVHVFSGSVIWTADGHVESEALRIEKGFARRFPRSQPKKGFGVPFGKVQFVRRIERTIQRDAGKALVAYDGFEYIAGRLRRGRSGFGWSGGWKPFRGGRGGIASIVDTPDDIVFGVSRTDRRQLRLSKGQDILRRFERPIALEPGKMYYVSCLVRRKPSSEPKEVNASRLLQIEFVGEQRRGHRGRSGFALGLTSEQRPFLGIGSLSVQSATQIEDGQVLFCVAKIAMIDDQFTEAYLRFYSVGETLEQIEPTAWTAIASSRTRQSEFTGVRLSIGISGECEVDELRIGTTWASVIASSSED